MRTIQLTNIAKEDIANIYDYGLRRFGINRADFHQDEMFKQFELIATHPYIGNEADKRRPGLLKFGFGVYMIFYTVSSDEIRIIRVLRGSMNYKEHL